MRNGYVSQIDETGALGPERLLSPDGDHAVVPALVGGSLVLVRTGDQLERTSIDTLALLERFTFPAIDQVPLVGAVGDRLVVAYAGASALTVDDFGSDLVRFDRTSAPLPPGATLGGSGSAVEIPGAVIFAIGINEGPRSFPWVVRVECRSR